MGKHMKKIISFVLILITILSFSVILISCNNSTVSCLSCGAENPDNVKYCSNCGTELSQNNENNDNERGSDCTIEY